MKMNMYDKYIRFVFCMMCYLIFITVMFWIRFFIALNDSSDSVSDEAVDIIGYNTTVPSVVTSDTYFSESIVSYIVTDDDIVTDEDIVTTVDFDALYALVCDAVCHYQRSVTVDCLLSYDDIVHLMNNLYYHFPAAFWIIDDFGCEFFDNRTNIVFVFADNMSENDVMRMNVKLEETIIRFLSGIYEPMSVRDKIKAAHDFILDNSVYDVSDENINNHNAFGCLVDGKAVCDGYAKGLSLLLDRLGIENGIVYGSETLTNSDVVSHAWNYVNIGGSYYWIDVTWDDYFEEKYDLGFYRYKYFLKKDNEFLGEHILLDDSDINDFVPICK